MIQLEKFKGSKTRHTCPSCGKRREFTRYLLDGVYISDDVGICNRQSNCGYHYTPKQFFADSPQAKTVRDGRQINKPKNYGFAPEDRSFTYLSPEHLKTTLGNYERNPFVQFLLNLFSDSTNEIQGILKMYFVGTFEDYTCFPSIDQSNRICRAKLIRFNPDTGKRLKGDYDTSSLPAKLKFKDFNYKQIFFGEHLLAKFPNKPAAIVEAEKTAIIASLYFPEFVWLGCNSKSWLKAERLKRLGERQIILYPDADGFEQWQSIAIEVQKLGLPVQVSSLIESQATDEQKRNGYDLADYLINAQRETNENAESAFSENKIEMRNPQLENDNLSVAESANVESTQAEIRTQILRSESRNAESATLKKLTWFDLCAACKSVLYEERNQWFCPKNCR